jgi:hypothetical protein
MGWFLSGPADQVPDRLGRFLTCVSKRFRTVAYTSTSTSEGLKGRWGSYPLTTVSIPELNLSQTYRYCCAERARVRSESRQSAMSQFLAKVEAIRKALGLRPAEELPSVGATFHLRCHGSDGDQGE